MDKESICETCEYVPLCSRKILGMGNTILTGCSRYEKRKVKTNFDRITQSVESLSEFINNFDTCPIHEEEYCPQIGKKFTYTYCNTCWADWLKKEVSDEK